MHKVKATVIFSLISVIIIGILFFAAYLSDINRYKKAVSDIAFSPIDISEIPDGVYDGAYDVGYISARVEVAINHGTIQRISLLNHKKKRGAPAEVITGTMLMEQKIDVDTISGATNSSKVIKKAVENALIQQ